MKLELVLITGMSGSGKSVALRALEDSGYYCVDNLPPELLLPFVTLEQKREAKRVAIAMDVRSADSLPLVPVQLDEMRRMEIKLTILFLDANTTALVNRYSETRRRHPLSSSEAPAPQPALMQAIEQERELLSQLRERAHVVDTSIMRSSQLQAYVKTLIEAPASHLTLVFQSFAFKRGVPMDADFVFDVRMLPNPYYEKELRSLSGLDAPVAAFLEQQADAMQMLEHIRSFLDHWLVAMGRDHRSYVTVAIGCTGGQHRSVYLVERLAGLFRDQWVTLTRHRELDSR